MSPWITSLLPSLSRVRVGWEAPGPWATLLRPALVVELAFKLCDWRLNLTKPLALPTGAPAAPTPPLLYCCWEVWIIWLIRVFVLCMWVDFGRLFTVSFYLPVWRSSSISSVGRSLLKKVTSEVATVINCFPPVCPEALVCTRLNEFF